MRIDENILLMRSKTLFRSQQSPDWKEIAELTAGVLDRWNIRMALFDLDEKGIASLKFHSMDADSEKWWEAIGAGSVEKLSIPLSKLPPMEEAVKNERVVFIPDMAQAVRKTLSKNLKGTRMPPGKAVFAPLMNEERPFGILVAMSPTLEQDDTLIISLIAHELSALIGGSELIRGLRESELLFKKVATKYRDMIDRLDDAILMADTSGRIQAVNERLRDSLNYSYQELIAMNINDLVYYRDREALRDALEQARKSATSFDIRLCSRGGDLIHADAVLTYAREASTYQGTFRIVGAPRHLEDEEGQNIHWMENITEKRTRKKKDYELLFESNINNLPGLVFFMNPEGKIVFVNQSPERTTGYTRDELMQHPLRWLERVHPDGRERIALAYQNALLTGQGHSSLGFKFFKKFGKECDFISTAIPIVDADGRLLGIQGIFQDITPILEKEREESESARRRNLMYENLNDLIFVVDVLYRIQMVNPACEALLGYSVEEMVGMPIENIIAESEMAKFRKGMKTATERGHAEGVIIRVRHKGGDEVFLEINATPVMEDGKSVAVRGIARNVTERVRLEERERVLQKELAQRERMAAIGELLATVSHGIRNPLASIRAVAQTTLEEIGQDSAARVPFRNIILESDRLETRIKEFLSFYKPFEPDLKPHRINNIITEALNMVVIRKKEQKIKLDLKLDWDIPPLLLDFAQIEQVLLNLIGNAFAAMPDGGNLKISSARVNTGAGEIVEVSIEDSGKGIPVDVKERIFQPFFTTKPQGTGMGLTVSRKIVENHGGGIRVENPPSGGARLVFWIPILEFKDDIERID